MAAASRAIGNRPADLTLDVVLLLGLLMLAAILATWRLPPVEYSSWDDDVNGLRTASILPG
jgi:hypothetical protein